MTKSKYRMGLEVKDGKVVRSCNLVPDPGTNIYQFLCEAKRGGFQTYSDFLKAGQNLFNDRVTDEVLDLLLDGKIHSPWPGIWEEDWARFYFEALAQKEPGMYVVRWTDLGKTVEFAPAEKAQYTVKDGKIVWSCIDCDIDQSIKDFEEYLERCNRKAPEKTGDVKDLNCMGCVYYHVLNSFCQHKSKRAPTQPGDICGNFESVEDRQ